MNKKFWQDKVVLVTGGAGFLGSHLVEELEKLNPKKIIVPRSAEHDLRNKEECLKLTKGVDIVLHLAANVGGIGYNQENPATLFYDNLLMGTYILEAARQNKVKKVVLLGTVCAYPKNTPVPFKESALWDGHPEETNAPYGLAKKMQLVQAQTYRDQYNFNAIYLLPVNLYGPRDEFDPQRSHVIPALIRKFVEAKENSDPEVEVWGTGKPTREFLYVGDAARGIILAAEKYNKSNPVNLGSSFEISIRDLAQTIKEVVGYRGRVVFDKSKPDGQPRRKLDVSLAKKEFGFESEIDFETGLRKTTEWFINHGR